MGKLLKAEAGGIVISSGNMYGLVSVVNLRGSVYITESDEYMETVQTSISVEMKLEPLVSLKFRRFLIAFMKSGTTLKEAIRTTMLIFHM